MVYYQKLVPPPPLTPPHPCPSRKVVFRNSTKERVRQCARELVATEVGTDEWRDPFEIVAVDCVGDGKECTGAQGYRLRLAKPLRPDPLGSPRRGRVSSLMRILVGPSILTIPHTD